MCTNEELKTRLKTMQESRMEVQIHVQCSHTKVTSKLVTFTRTDDDGGSHEEQRMETHEERVITYEETIDFEYGACVDRSPHSVNYEGFNMCGLAFNCIYEWGDPDIALRYKLALQQAHDDNAARDKEVSVVSTFKITPMSPCCIKRGKSSFMGMDWWMLAFLTGLVAYYDCWIGSTAGVADMDIRKVLCTKGTVSDNLDDNETSSHHHVSVAVPMADYIGDHTWRHRNPFTNPSPEYIASFPMRARNPCKIEDDKKMSYSCISNGRDLEVGQEVVVSFKNFGDIKEMIAYRPQYYTHNYNNVTGLLNSSVRGKIANVLPSVDSANDTMYNVELYAESSDVENTTSDAIVGRRVRAFHDSAVVAHVGDRNVLSDVKLACVHCQELRAMEGFEFCGACGKAQKQQGIH